MTVSKLLEEFSKLDALPVEVEKVIEHVRARGVNDIITFFHDVDLDTKLISGFLKRDEFQKDGKQRFLSTITYGKLGHEMERLVCCKELLHILDPDSSRAHERTQVESLISKISLPPELVDPIDDEQSSNDRIAILEAMAVLFPLGARNILYDKYMNERVSLAWIAEQAELPAAYVKYAMNGFWPSLLEILIGRRKRIEEKNGKSSLR